MPGSNPGGPANGHFIGLFLAYSDYSGNIPRSNLSASMSAFSGSGSLLLVTNTTPL